VHYTFVICYFFEAEDGIRDFHVTGVQTCALPILPQPGSYGVGDHFLDDFFNMGAQLRVARHEQIADAVGARLRQINALSRHFLRSEERRVGEECTYSVAQEQTSQRTLDIRT